MDVGCRQTQKSWFLSFVFLLYVAGHTITRRGPDDTTDDLELWRGYI